MHPQVPMVRTGFVQPEDLPKYYAAADVLMVPSLLDRWPLVCLEALVAGLPQVTSSMVGSAPDLVVSSEIGDVIDPRDAKDFADRLAVRICKAPTLVPESLRTDAVAKWSSTGSAIRGSASFGTCLEAK